MMSTQPQQNLAVIWLAFLFSCFLSLQFIPGSMSMALEGGTCPPNTFMCLDGSQCIEKVKQCDGTPDCTDATDEYDCGKAEDTFTAPAITNETCAEGSFHCQDDASKCMPQDFVCDGTAHCSDASDEMDCKGKCMEPANFLCDDGRCMTRSVVCDGIADCIDSSDESNCTFRTTTTPPDKCTQGEFRCPDGTCVSKYRFCDGRKDCDDGSDEEHRRCIYNPSPTDIDTLEPVTPWIIEKGNCSDLDFQCLDETCIPGIWECDSVIDCPDGSDEEANCKKTNCTEDSFMCHDGQCVEKHLRCDHKKDCSDGSDEMRCGDRIIREMNLLNPVDAKKIENLNEERTFRTEIHELQLKEMFLKQDAAKEELEAVKNASEHALELAIEKFRAAELEHQAAELERQTAELERQAAEDKLNQQRQLFQLKMEAAMPDKPSIPVP